MLLHSLKCSGRRNTNKNKEDSLLRLNILNVGIMLLFEVPLDPTFMKYIIIIYTSIYLTVGGRWP